MARAVLVRKEKGKGRLNVAAEIAGVHVDTIRRWQDAGELTLYRTRGGHRRVDLDELRALLAKWVRK